MEPKDLMELRRKRAELTEQIQKECKDVFASMSNEIFNRYSEVTSFSWTQYTPYFNDGDTCEFGVNHDYPLINGEDWDRDCSLTVGWPSQPNPDYNPRKAEIYKTIKEFLRTFDTDEYQTMFDDHCTVTIHRDGRIEEEEYNHD